jgi:ATP-dependent protease ClpP protease subunit
LRPIGVVAGECSSAALFPFAACPERYVLPYSTLLFHPIRWQSDESVRVEEAAEWSRHFQQMEPALDELLSQMFPLSPEKLHAWTRPGRFVTGAELVEEGLATLVDMFSGDVWQQARRAEVE